ncbi:hypothetical protein TNCV_3014881 [Trichonephila clavipes]|nr:hypothetical protein TNCV_3014881 [Trichonephila clavipes]
MDRLKSEKTSGMSITCPAATDKRATKSSADVTGLSNTKLLIWPQKKKSKQLCDESIRNFITNLLNRPFREI